MKAWDVVTPDVRLTSWRPLFNPPAPSAMKLPAMAIEPPASKPVNKKAYWPFSSALLTPAAVTVMVAEPDLVGSVTEVAVIVTVAGFGTTAGAV